MSVRMAGWVRCPRHHTKVGVDKHNHVLGRCGLCAAEAAVALRTLRGPR